MPSASTQTAKTTKSAKTPAAKPAAKATKTPAAKTPAKPKTPAKSKAKAAAPDQTPVELDTPVTPLETPETPTTPGGTKVRRSVTPESVDEEFSSLLQDIANELIARKSSGTASSADLKFLRSVSRRVAVLQKDTQRFTKKKRVNSTTTAENSALCRDGPITDELAKFLGVEPGTQISRAECTRQLQQYIKNNNLQKSSDGRIIQPNKDLTKLLKYNAKDHVDTTLNAKGVPKNPEGLLYYWVMQKLIQKHFVSEK